MVPGAGLDWTEVRSGAFSETGSMALSANAHTADRTCAVANKPTDPDLHFVDISFGSARLVPNSRPLGVRLLDPIL